VLFLDTTVLIDALRGRGAADRVRALRRRGDVPLICAINVDEVWRGARPGEEDVIRTFLTGLRLVPLGRAEGELAGTWRREYAERGITLQQAGCLVAAAALRAGATLATGNPDDFPFRELAVEHWPVGAVPSG
jgi:predicted nucleic acid-binding protein